ncbi:4'-phosphopantetheinyl transferase [Phlegmacium glaucopus]|nr:4'-phosphopantetheinyl transferase [Phlegmacium glaucopus]
MQVWAVIYKAHLFTDTLYQSSLPLVDQESQIRIRRFYRRDDSCRTLIGRLLVRVMLKKRGVPCDQMRFATTTHGKPYIVAPDLDPPIKYNITHDNDLVAMAFTSGDQQNNIGIDVMKVRIPGRESFASFVETVGNQLTPTERHSLNIEVPPSEQLRRFFWMWTLKEAYTKALGLGLGFDFQRVEFDVVNRIVRVDGQIPQGWHFSMFVIEDGEDLYQGVVAEQLGGTSTEVNEPVKPDWLTIHDAVPFTESAIGDLVK